MSFRARPSAPIGWVLVLALWACATVSLPARACAEPRFGDSTWVAPAGPAEGSPEEPGPRVARPDHERGWETVLRTPFRLAFLPLRLLARGIEATGPFVEKHFPPGAMNKPPSTKRGLKFQPELIGATVAAPNFAGPGSKLALTGTYSLTDSRKLRFRGWAGDGVSQIGVGGEAMYDYRPNRRFYGIGNFSNSDETYFLRRTDLASGYVFAGKNHLRRVRVTAGVSDIDIGPGYNGTAGSKRSIDVFSPVDVPFLTTGSRLWWYGASANLAVLDDSLGPSRGLHFRPDVKRYRSTDDSGLRYDQWRLEARGYLPVFAKRRVLAGRLVYEGVDRKGGSAPLPFYRLPESSDADRFAGYHSGRFRDQRLALGTAEYRWEIMPPIWAVLFGELGAVASETSSLTLRGAHPSLGGGLRAKIGTQVARLDIARGHEGIVIRADLGVDF
jgi:hypothetical protein